MVSSALHDRLPSRPSINSFKKSAPDIVGVGGASAEVRGYIDVALQIAGIEVAHPLLVIKNLSIPLIIGMDLLQPHAAKVSLGSAAPLELSARVCDVCLKQRTNLNPSYRSSPVVASAAESTTLAPKSASLVTVRLPRAVQYASTVLIELLNSTVVIFGCAALTAVSAPIADVAASLWLIIPRNRSIFSLDFRSHLSTLFVSSRNRFKQLPPPFACPTSRNFDKCFTS